MVQQAVYVLKCTRVAAMHLTSYTDRLLAVMLPIRYRSHVLHVLWRVADWDLKITDVVKSRVQLRDTPPTGTPVQYIAREMKAIIAESGM